MSEISFLLVCLEDDWEKWLLNDSYVREFVHLTECEQTSLGFEKPFINSLGNLCLRVNFPISYRKFLWQELFYVARSQEVVDQYLRLWGEDKLLFLAHISIKQLVAFQLYTDILELGHQLFGSASADLRLQAENFESGNFSNKNEAHFLREQVNRYQHILARYMTDSLPEKITEELRHSIRVIFSSSRLGKEKS